MNNPHPFESVSVLFMHQEQIFAVQRQPRPASERRVYAPSTTTTKANKRAMLSVFVYIEKFKRFITGTF